MREKKEFFLRGALVVKKGTLHVVTYLVHREKTYNKQIPNTVVIIEGTTVTTIATDYR
jgi:hypothetical protein